MPLTTIPFENTGSRSPRNPLACRASTSHASTAPEKNVNPSPSSTDASAHAQNGALHTHMSQYSTVAAASTAVPIRNEARRPTVSATTPVGTSNSTIPTVKKALAAKASRLVSPASSRNSVLTPQMNDAASVLPAMSTR
jgi:hypothetical protein